MFTILPPLVPLLAAWSTADKEAEKTEAEQQLRYDHSEGACHVNWDALDRLAPLPGLKVLSRQVHGILQLALSLESLVQE